jgi:hypothetical protein
MTLNPGYRLCVALVAPIARHGQLLIKAAFFCQLEASPLMLATKANLCRRLVADVVRADQSLALLSVFDSARLFGEGQLQRMVQIFLRIRFGDYR